MTRRGFKPYRLISAATTNATSVAAPQYGSKLLGYEISNSGATAAYVKFYNLAVAPTLSSSTPVKTLLVPAGGVISISYPDYFFFPAGLALAITGAYADTDITAVALGQVIVNLCLGA